MIDSPPVWFEKKKPPDRIPQLNIDKISKYGSVLTFLFVI